MTGLKIEGVVFDVDGVLFDTERLTQQTWLAVSREMGWPQVGEAYLEFVGQNRADIFQKMEDLFGAEFPKDAFMAACSARSQARMETAWGRCWSCCGAGASPPPWPPPPAAPGQSGGWR